MLLSADYLPLKIFSSPFNRPVFKGFQIYVVLGV